MQRASLLVAIGLLLAACGGSDGESDNGDIATTTVATADVQSAASSGGSAEPIGPADMNTIRIGDNTWNRTLPMTTGQCFLYEDDGNLPTSAVAWGTLDGDDDWRFSASQNQDGTFEAEVTNNAEVYWFAGARSPGVDDLEIVLDFEALTITGSGTFSDVLGNAAGGSFAFQCEPDQG